jgi:hypothetical protein
LRNVIDRYLRLSYHVCKESSSKSTIDPFHTGSQNVSYFSKDCRQYFLEIITKSGELQFSRWPSLFTYFCTDYRNPPLKD